MILSRLDKIGALDVDDIISRMYVNDLMENTGDDLRSSRIRLKKSLGYEWIHFNGNPKYAWLGSL